MTDLAERDGDMRHCALALGLFQLGMGCACSSPASRDSTRTSQMSLTQDWESGGGDWVDGNGQPPTFVNDAASPAGQTVQQINRATANGDYFSPLIDVVGGQTYCIRAKLKWVSGAAPFVGVEQYANGVSEGVSWVIGTKYSDANVSTAVVNATNAEWQDIGKTLVLSPDTTQVRLVDELWNGASKGGDPLAYFDALSFDSGACSPMPYFQDWESGAANWQDRSGEAPVLLDDSSSLAGKTVQQIGRATGGGDYFSPILDIDSGETYCVRTKIKWLGGAAPFVGLEQYASNVSQGITWLIGTSYPYRFGPSITTIVNSSDPGWQEFAETVPLNFDTTRVRLVDELWPGSVKTGANLSYFDGFSIDKGQCAPVPYSQNWELGLGSWKDPTGPVPTLVTDVSSPSGQNVQQITQTTNGGNFFSPFVDVVGGQSYCVRAKIKWVGGAAPFVGIQQYADHNSQGITWLIGSEYTDSLTTTTALNRTNAGWQEFAETLDLSLSTTRVRVVDELWAGNSKSGSSLAYFDGFSIDAGRCTPGTSTPYTQNWESGVGNWTDASAQPPTLVNDTSSPAGQTVQQLSRAKAGGDCFSPFVDVVGGHGYCVRAKVKWLSGNPPFVGVEQYANHLSLGTQWLIGTQYSDAKSTTAVLSNTASGWQEFSQTLVAARNATRLRFVDELFPGNAKGGLPLAYFDGFSIEEGPCSAVPYAQDWESGANDWRDQNGQAPTLTEDTSSPGGMRVQQISRATGGGDYFSPMLSVGGNNGYLCLRAKVKWVSGAAPFVGVEQFANYMSRGVSWVIGTPPYVGEYTALVSSTNTGWQEFEKTLFLNGDTTQVRLVDELWSGSSKGGASQAYFDGLSLGSGPCTPLSPYLQDWESGTGSWKDVNGQEPTLVSETSSPAGSTVQQLTRAIGGAGGDFFSPLLEVASGQTYCVQANLKWVSGAAPFVGIEQYSLGTSQGVNWLMGSPYSDERGSTTIVNDSDASWQQIAVTIGLLVDATRIRLVDRLYAGATKGGDNLAYADGLSIRSGSCGASSVTELTIHP